MTDSIFFQLDAHEKYNLAEQIKKIARESLAWLTGQKCRHHQSIHATTASNPDKIERLTRQGEEIRDKRQQAAREKEKNETPKTKQITEKEKTKIVNKLYEDAKRRNYVHYKQLAEPRHVVEGRVYGETDDQPPHSECTFHPTIRKKSQNLTSTRRTLAEEDESVTTRLYKDAMKRKESQSALEEDTPQFKDSLRDGKEIAQQKYLEVTKKNRKERLDNEHDEKEEPKTTFRKRIVLPSDEISPKKVTLEQNRIDSLTARLYRESETIEKRRMERARVLDHEAKEQSKTARPDKKSLTTVEQKQRKRIDEVFLHLVSGLREWKSENVGSPNLPDDGENHTTPQQNQETEALLNVTELGVVISLPTIRLNQKMEKLEQTAFRNKRTLAHPPNSHRGCFKPIFHNSESLHSKDRVVRP
ncbi:hypothetical protein BLNAU_11305 [Blattamonas nauphoetae]|uniref:Uncharacterized protein n=1 Tax=Blattamonas nauphoetae TaxID=2049346 RepID=A0ABQ9XQV6_9EUKA|nr:hypothetical protein BLNAU_11305 [Blattamonas nauphoetae]